LIIKAATQTPTATSVSQKMVDTPVPDRIINLDQPPGSIEKGDPPIGRSPLTVDQYEQNV